MKYIALTFLLLLSACGFKPLYQSGNGGAAIPAYVQGIEVAPISDRLGQQVRFHLQERLGNRAFVDYRLNIILGQETESFGIKPDTSATQEQLTVSAFFSLVRLSDGATILSDTYLARTSYDVVISDFATVMQREDSAKRLALDLADRIHRNIAFHFSKNEGGKPAGAQ